MPDPQHVGLAGKVGSLSGEGFPQIPIQPCELPDIPDIGGPNPEQYFPKWFIIRGLGRASCLLRVGIEAEPSWRLLVSSL